MNNFKISVLALSISALFGCGGSDGDDPTPPTYSVLVSTSALTSGDSHCSDGGYSITAGYDVDGDGALDAEEYEASTYICNDSTQTFDDEGNEIFSEAIVTVAMIAQGDHDCDTGGQNIIYGTDDNNNSILDGDEINSHVMCNVGSYVAPDTIINAITASSSTVAAGSTVTLTATITASAGSTDVLEWSDEDGNILSDTDASIDITVGSDEGAEIYYLSVTRTNADGSINMQRRQISVTVGQAASVTQVVSLDTQQVYLPDGYSINSVTGDISGTVIYADPITSSVAVSSMAIPTPDDTELVGFVAERGALNQGTNASSLISGMLAAYSYAFPFATLSAISVTTLDNGDVTASYNLTLSTAMMPTALLANLMSQMAVNVVGGSMDDLEPASTEVESLSYQIDLVVSYDDVADRAVITATLVAKDKADTYSDLISATTSESITSAIGATLELQNDVFTAIDQTTSKADFLFVIDNSGSMYDEQTELSALSESFKNTVANAGLDFMVGTITTDSSTLRGVGFTNDTTQIASDLLPGTYGSATETGIYYAEEALTETTGSVALAGYPRENASMSVVIMSDERSQYTSRGSAEFDVNNNLFIDNGYKVYSLIDLDQNDYSQYDDLADTTGGSTLNIEETTEYDTFMTNIANNAGALSAGYTLSLSETNQILSSSIAVTVDGVEVTRDTSDGWQYYSSSQKIVFTGSAIPTAGSEIKVSYQYVAE